MRGWCTIYLACPLEGWVVVAEGAQGIGATIGPRQREEHQLKAVQRACQALVQLDGSTLAMTHDPSAFASTRPDLASIGSMSHPVEVFLGRPA